MKIISQTESEMTLKDSNYWGVFIAIITILFGFFFTFESIVTSPIGPIIGGVICWIIALAVAFIAIFLCPSLTFVINKSDGIIFFHMKRIILSKTATYQIGDVSRIELRKAYRNTSKGTQVITQSVIIFKDGTEVPLEGKKAEAALGAFGFVMGGDSAKQKKELSISEQVATFINVPFQEISPDNNSSGIELPGGIQL
jgi:ABC-type multidrug transport system permease subunit